MWTPCSCYANLSSSLQDIYFCLLDLGFFFIPYWPQFSLHSALEASLLLVFIILHLVTACWFDHGDVVYTYGYSLGVTVSSTYETIASASRSSVVRQTLLRLVFRRTPHFREVSPVYEYLLKSHGILYITLLALFSAWQWRLSYSDILLDMLIHVVQNCTTQVKDIQPYHLTMLALSTFLLWAYKRKYAQISKTGFSEAVLILQGISLYIWTLNIAWLLLISGIVWKSRFGLNFLRKRSCRNRRFGLLCYATGEEVTWSSLRRGGGLNTWNLRYVIFPKL